jgi:hypothetical protein
MQDQLGLCCRRPEASTGTFAVAEAWTIKGEHAVLSERQVEHAASHVILEHGPIAMQEDDSAATFSLIYIVEADAVDFDELASWRGLGFCSPSLRRIEQCSARECHDHARGGEPLFRRRRTVVQCTKLLRCNRTIMDPKLAS